MCASKYTSGQPTPGHSTHSSAQPGLPHHLPPGSHGKGTPPAPHSNPTAASAAAASTSLDTDALIKSGDAKNVGTLTGPDGATYTAYIVWVDEDGNTVNPPAQSAHATEATNKLAQKLLELTKAKISGDKSLTGKKLSYLDEEGAHFEGGKLAKFSEMGLKITDQTEVETILTGYNTARSSVTSFSPADAVCTHVGYGDYAKKLTAFNDAINKLSSSSSQADFDALKDFFTDGNPKALPLELRGYFLHHLWRACGHPKLGGAESIAKHALDNLFKPANLKHIQSSYKNTCLTLLGSGAVKPKSAVTDEQTVLNIITSVKELAVTYPTDKSSTASGLVEKNLQQFKDKLPPQEKQLLKTRLQTKLVPFRGSHTPQQFLKASLEVLEELYNVSAKSAGASAKYSDGDFVESSLRPQLKRTETEADIVKASGASSLPADLTPYLHSIMVLRANDPVKKVTAHLRKTDLKKNYDKKTVPAVTNLLVNTFQGTVRGLGKTVHDEFFKDFYDKHHAQAKTKSPPAFDPDNAKHIKLAYEHIISSPAMQTEALESLDESFHRALSTSSRSAASAAAASGASGDWEGFAKAQYGGSAPPVFSNVADAKSNLDTYNADRAGHKITFDVKTLKKATDVWNLMIQIVGDQKATSSASAKARVVMKQTGKTPPAKASSKQAKKAQALRGIKVAAARKKAFDVLKSKLQKMSMPTAPSATAVAVTEAELLKGLEHLVHEKLVPMPTTVPTAYTEILALTGLIQSSGGAPLTPSAIVTLCNNQPDASSILTALEAYEKFGSSAQLILTPPAASASMANRHMGPLADIYIRNNSDSAMPNFTTVFPSAQHFIDKVQQEYHKLSPGTAGYTSVDLRSNLTHLVRSVLVATEHGEASSAHVIPTAPTSPSAPPTPPPVPSTAPHDITNRERLAKYSKFLANLDSPTYTVTYPDFLKAVEHLTCPQATASDTSPASDLAKVDQIKGLYYYVASGPQHQTTPEDHDWAGTHIAQDKAALKESLQAYAVLGAEAVSLVKANDFSTLAANLNETGDSGLLSTIRLNPPIASLGNFNTAFTSNDEFIACVYDELGKATTSTINPPYEAYAKAHIADDPIKLMQAVRAALEVGKNWSKTTAYVAVPATASAPPMPAASSSRRALMTAVNAAVWPVSLKNLKDELAASNPVNYNDFLLGVQQLVGASLIPMPTTRPPALIEIETLYFHLRGGTVTGSQTISEWVENDRNTNYNSYIKELQAAVLAYELLGKKAIELVKQPVTGTLSANLLANTAAGLLSKIRINAATIIPDLATTHPNFTTVFPDNDTFIAAVLDKLGEAATTPPQTAPFEAYGRTNIGSSPTDTMNAILAAINIAKTATSKYTAAVAPFDLAVAKAHFTTFLGSLETRTSLTYQDFLQGVEYLVGVSLNPIPPPYPAKLTTIREVYKNLVKGLYLPHAEITSAALLAEKEAIRTTLVLVDQISLDEALNLANGGQVFGKDVDKTNLIDPDPSHGILAKIYDGIDFTTPPVTTAHGDLDTKQKFIDRVAAHIEDIETTRTGSPPTGLTWGKDHIADDRRNLALAIRRTIEEARSADPTLPVLRAAVPSPEEKFDAALRDLDAGNKPASLADFKDSIKFYADPNATGINQKKERYKRILEGYYLLTRAATDPKLVAPGSNKHKKLENAISGVGGGSVDTAILAQVIRSDKSLSDLSALATSDDTTDITITPASGSIKATKDNINQADTGILAQIATRNGFADKNGFITDVHNYYYQLAKRVWDSIDPTTDSFSRNFLQPNHEPGTDPHRLDWGTFYIDQDRRLLERAIHLASLKPISRN